MPLWRPPSEGSNFIIQATLGCSFNACTFCTMYKHKDYRARPLDEVFADIEDAACDWPDATRVFLADGDALVLPTDDLAQILDKLIATFPDLQRVTCYATPQNLTKKSPEDLIRLREKRLSMVYLGIESGSDKMLRRIRKGSAKLMEKALVAAENAGIKVSATVILGLGGKAHWREHIEGTAALINRAPPKFLSTLQLGLESDQEPRFRQAFDAANDAGEVGFEWQDDDAILAELAYLLELLDPPKAVIFRSNHASNALPLAGNLPRDTASLLAQVRAVQGGSGGLRPKHLRGL
ncbi:radical SAM protein [Magnetovibrio sp.]|uniref:radical SAM protein n=1 Tax=Magnetovibrio sp. TaxID=2024836 RepID=UPI002F92F756